MAMHIFLAALAMLLSSQATFAQTPQCGGAGQAVCPAPYLSAPITFRPTNQTFGLYTAAPAGSCPVNGSIYGSATALYQCRSGTWTALGGGGGGGVTSLGGMTGAIACGSNLTCSAGTISATGASVPGAGVVRSTGSALATETIGSGLLESAGTLSANSVTIDTLSGAGAMSGTDQVLMRQGGTSSLLGTLSDLAAYVRGTISGGIAAISDGVTSITSGTVTMWGTHISGTTVISGGLFNIASPPPALSSWTQIGSIPAISQSPSGIISMTGAGISAPAIIGLMRAAPSAPYRVSALVSLTGSDINNLVGFQWGFSDGTKFDSYQFYSTYSVGSVPYISAEHDTFSNSTTRNSYANGQLAPFPATAIFYIAWEDDGTNFKMEWSANGVQFATLYSGVKSSGYLGGSGYTNLFISPYSQSSGSVQVSIISYNPNALTASFP